MAEHANNIAGGGSKAAAARLQAQGQYEADNSKADQADEAAGYGRVRAAQTHSYLLDNIQKSLPTMNAITASSGADPNSPSSLAVMNAARGQAIARGIQVSNMYAQADSDEASAAWYRQAGQTALMGGSSAASGAELSGWLGAGVRSCARRADSILKNMFGGGSLSTAEINTALAGWRLDYG